MNILDEIAAKTKERIAMEKKKISPETIRREAEEAVRAGCVYIGACVSGAESGLVREAEEHTQHLDADASIPYEPYAFGEALGTEGISFICEVKKASPSKGLIAPDFPYVQIAREYEQAGAAAISCLTEPYYFQGRDQYLREIVRTVHIPVLRKDFTVDEYMIYQARVLGAGAVLLICSILDDGQLKAYGQLARELGLSALVEAHTEEEVERAMRSDAKIIGVNNRDLKTFQVDLGTSARYRRMVPPEVLFVSESGIRNADDIKKLVENGTNAVLIGETLMRAKDKKAMLRKLRGEM
ncbi:MAG: indole-3-glycerol phosphate synthase TrpC [Clostridiales bacterium]|nr:indole-3-glycerol phosphate synthase TrpC [Clostridiales bacterium]